MDAPGSEKPRALLVFLALLLVCGGILTARFSAPTPVFDTDLQSILPHADEQKQAQQVAGVLSSVFSDRVAFLVEADSPERAKTARTALQAQLVAANLFIDDQADTSATGRWIFENRREILCEASAAEFTEETAEQVWRSAIGQVFGVGIPVTGEQLQADPFLLTYRLADCLSGELGAAGTQDALLTGRLTSPAGAFETQSAIADILSAWQADWSGQGVRLVRMGAVFHAAHGAASAKREVTLIGSISLAGVILIFLFAFRRLGSLVLVSLLIGSSILAGLSATLLVFPKVHLLVLVFAATLVGIVADYAVHAMAARFSNDWPDAQTSRLLIRRPLTVSMLTTVIGFAGLLFLNVGMLAQLAVFAVSGIVSAWLLVQWVLIPFDTPPSNRGPRKQAWTVRAERAGRLIGYRPVLIACSALFAGLTVLGIARHTTLDDVRRFQPRDAQLLAEEAQIARLLNTSPADLYLVSQGATLNEAKRAEETAAGILGADQISGARFSRFDPSQEKRAAARAVIADRLEAPYLGAAREMFGLREAEPATQAAAVRPDWLNQLHLETDDGKHFLVAPVSLASGPTPALGDNAHLVDIPSTYSDAFARYRHLTGVSLSIASVIAMIAVVLIFRDPRSALVVLCPCAAMLGGIFIPCLFGMPVSFFSVAAGMVLFGIGIDYAAFFWESRTRRENWTLASVLIGAATTEVSMGLLSLSDTFPVQSFGITVATGVVCALSYTILLLGQSSRGESLGETEIL
ncbi:MAG: lipoprotein transmembrane [Hyphomonadaceae bacterium]|nr:lipoprotein transmembrane [Hyphomonadaceae bacterium]